MNKTLVFRGLVLCLLLAFVVTACGQGAAPTATPAPTKAAATSRP